jgi:hypothetical protein
VSLRTRLKAAAAAFRAPAKPATPVELLAPAQPSRRGLNPSCLYCELEVDRGGQEHRTRLVVEPTGRHVVHFAHLACIPRAPDGSLSGPPSTQHEPESE